MIEWERRVYVSRFLLSNLYVDTLNLRGVYCGIVLRVIKDSDYSVKIQIILKESDVLDF